jgi:HAD superfamily hydrolase (TIGR01509 family)
MNARDSRIEWVFFDVGSVLFNDDPQNYLANRLVHNQILERHPDYSFDQMLSEREQHARDGASWILLSIVKRLLPDLPVRDLLQQIRTHLLPSYDANHLPNAGVPEVLEELRQRYRLGIIANQPAECRASLERRGLLGHFDVIAISEELDLHKPDVRLYEWALRECGCPPARTVMIGDRRDNDIVPARQVSMRTILVEWPNWDSRNWRPDDALALAFLESCDRVPLFKALVTPGEPDRIVRSLGEIPAALESLCREAASILPPS